MAFPTLKERLLALITEAPGLTDKELAYKLLGRREPQAVNQAARQLESARFVTRTQRHDGLIGNYPAGQKPAAAMPVHRPKALPAPPPSPLPPPSMTRPASSNALVGTTAPKYLRMVPLEAWPEEDYLKRRLKEHLEADGWTVTVMWGRKRGVDVHAIRGEQNWMFEVKGRGAYQQVTANYFLGMLGEMLQRISDPDALYTIVMPDVPQFRRLWKRLPTLAKERTAISAAFVAEDGKIDFS